MKKFTETKYVLGKKQFWYHLVDESTGMGAMSQTRNYRRLKKVLSEELAKSLK